MKKQIKYQLSHELSNLLNYIQITIHESSATDEEKDKILHWIDLAAILVNFQDIFNKKTIDLALSETDAKGLINPILALNHEAARKRGIAIKTEGFSFKMNIDTFLFGEAFALLIKYLISIADGISIRLKPRTKEIEISYKCSASECIEIRPIIESLQKDNLNNMVIPLQLSLKLFSLQNIPVKPKAGKISLVLR